MRQSGCRCAGSGGVAARRRSGRLDRCQGRGTPFADAASLPLGIDLVVFAGGASVVGCGLSAGTLPTAGSGGAARDRRDLACGHTHQARPAGQPCQEGRDVAVFPSRTQALVGSNERCRVGRRNLGPGAVGGCHQATPQDQRDDERRGGGEGSAGKRRLAQAQRQQVSARVELLNARLGLSLASGRLGR